MKKLFIVIFTMSLLGASPVYAAPAQSFKNCTALNKVYEGGVALNKKATNRNSKGQPQKSKYTPFVNKKIYNMNKRLDRDKDKIACER
jgi:hypothetical protein